MINKKFLLTLSAAVIATALTGCSEKLQSNSDRVPASNSAESQEVNLHLKVPRFTNVYYTNSPVDLVVIDSRSHKLLGSTSSAVSEKLTPIYPENELEDSVEETLEAALSHQGHDVSIKSSAKTANEIIVNDLCNVENPKINNTMIVNINNLYAEGLIDNQIKANATIEVSLRYCSEGKIHFQDKQFSTNVSYSSNGTSLTKDNIKLAVEDVLNKNIGEIVVNNELQKFMATHFERVKYSS